MLRCSHQASHTLHQYRKRFAIMSDANEFERIVKSFHEDLEAEAALAMQTDDSEALKKVVRKKVQPELAKIMKSMIDLSVEGDSETARIAAARFVYSFYFGKDPSPAEEDTFSKL